MTPQEKVIAVARKYATQKYKEGANNDTIFGKWFGLNHQPWCAMFVSYVFNEAGYPNLLKGSQTPKGFASCQIGLQWFRNKHQVVNKTEAEPGDIVFFQFDSDPMADHVGIVVTNNGGTLTTIEGNTVGSHSGSQANGDGVYVKTRPLNQVMAVARPKYPKAPVA